MLDLDLDSGPLLSLDLEGPLDQLAHNHHAVAPVERLRCVLGDRSPCRVAEEPVVDVLPLAVELAAVADRDGEACEGRAVLGVAELRIVGDVSDQSNLGSSLPLFPGHLLAAPEVVPTLNGSSPRPDDGMQPTTNSSEHS